MLLGEGWKNNMMEEKLDALEQATLYDGVPVVTMKVNDLAYLVYEDGRYYMGDGVEVTRAQITKAIKEAKFDGFDHMHKNTGMKHARLIAELIRHRGDAPQWEEPIELWKCSDRGLKFGDGIHRLSASHYLKHATINVMMM